MGINRTAQRAPRTRSRAFLRERPAAYPMVLDADGQVNDLYKVVALPHLVLVGRDGTVLKTFWGVTTRREIAERPRGGGGRR